MNRFENFKAGLIKDNPVFSLFLGICSTLAITTTVNNASYEEQILDIKVAPKTALRRYRGWLT